MERLETLVEGRIQPSDEYLDRVEKDFVAAMQRHDWDVHFFPDDEPRQALARATYEQILRVADVLPVDRLLPLWEQHKNQRPATATELQNETQRQLIGRIKKVRK